MPDIPRPQLAVYAAAALAILLVGARYLATERPSSQTGSTAAGGAAHVAGPATGAGGRVVVQVAGAVRDPGVYRLSAGDRADDAVRRAGGATARADLAGVNLASKLEDGRQIIVPERPPAGGAAVGADGAGAGAAASGAAPGAGVQSAPLNLNTATPEQLDGLDGIGPETARKIVAYRQAHGGFRSVNELDQVPGIGEKRLGALRELVTV